MNAQAKLLELAQKHRENPAVSTLLTSLLECRTVANQHLDLMCSMAAVRSAALEGREGYTVPYDNSDLVTASAKASGALSRMAGDFSNLACVLQALGEDIHY